MANLPFILLFGFILSIVLIGRSRFSEKVFQGRSWMILRALFPSWRFFEDLSWIPKLQIRIAQNNENFTDHWIDGFISEPRTPASLFLNGRGNLRMANQSLLEQFCSDLADLPSEDTQAADISRLVSYELVENLVRFQIRNRGLAGAGEKFQFKILSAIPGQTENTTRDEMMISAVHEV